ncbi:MAG TPA: META domain-containing protein [Vicinamibacteria bacterium]|nr:META domain-containing protein [Vicinamibacteria bacterium]
MSLAHRNLAAAPRMARYAAGVLTLVALTSCEDAVTAPSDLGGEWRLTSLSGLDAVPTPPPATGRFTLQFEADGQVFVHADCNGCGGRYTLGGHTVTVSRLACTLIFCPSSPFDARYLSLLDGEAAFDLEGDVLTITSPRGTLRFAR